MKINLSTLIFIHTTWVYLFSNILIAHMGGALSTIIQLLRDSWVFYPFIIAIKQKDLKIILLLIYLIIIGLILIISDVEFFKIPLFFYALRDYSLIILIVQLIRIQKFYSIKFSHIIFFLSTIILLSTLSFIVELINPKINDLVFNTNNYFKNKGVSSNVGLGFGLFGSRLIHPLYSPNLLGQLLFFSFLLFGNKEFRVKNRWIGNFLGALTVSKGILVVLYFRIFGTKGLKFLAIFLVVAFFSLLSLQAMLEDINNFTIRYHLSSIIGHLMAFNEIRDFIQLIPEYFGSRSVLNNVLLGINERGIESTLIARLLELKLFFSIPLIAFITYSFKGLERNKKIILSCFYTLILLTATANHPVYIIPIIYLINAKNSYLPNNSN